MAFTGKATYSARTTLPELVEDVSDLIGIISPYETPLLDALGDPLRETTSTHHEWLEDNLLPNKGRIDEPGITNPLEKEILVVDGNVFRVGDQLQVKGSDELMLVTTIHDKDGLTVERGYAGTKPEPLKDGQIINILGNPEIKNRFTERIHCSNYTQKFTATVKVRTSDIAASQLGLVRKLLRDLENAVINETPDPRALENSPLYKGTWERKIRGIIPTLKTNIVDANNDDLSEKLINSILKQLWENSNGNIDLIVVGGIQSRKLKNCVPKSLIGQSRTYESDYGICQIIACRRMPQDAAVFLDSSRISVLPLAGRSFHFKPLASSGDYECGELSGEYTLELKNEAAHGLIKNLSIKSHCNAETSPA